MYLIEFNKFLNPAPPPPEQWERESIVQVKILLREPLITVKKLRYVEKVKSLFWVQFFFIIVSFVWCNQTDKQCLKTLQEVKSALKIKE